MNLRGHFLIISDDKQWKKNFGSLLKREGAEVTESGDLEEAIKITWRSQIDFIILDLTLCGENLNKPGRDLKNEKPASDIPLLIVLAEEQLSQLDVQNEADDFLLKRSHNAEALARIERLFFHKIYHGNEQIFKTEDLVIDLENYEVSNKGQTIYLTFKEFELLKFLLLNRGKVFSRDILLNKVWGYNNYVGTRTVDIHIQRLRNKLGATLGNRILTVRNVGYKFVSP